MPSAGTILSFPPYEVDLGRGELRKFGIRVRLERKPWHLLIVLLERPGELVTRAELQAALWPDGTFVDFEHGLNVAVKKLRAALCDSRESPRYIETVAGEGYRFIADVQAIVAPVAAPVAVTIASSGPGQAQEPAPALPASIRSSRFRQGRLAFAVAIAACVALFSIAVAAGWRRKTGNTQDAHKRKVMLVVLPFENLSGDPSQEYVSDGMTEELSSQLGNLDPDRLGVIGRTSAMAYKGSHATIGDVGKQLGVDYVLEGSVRRDGSKLRATAQLIETSNQAHVWAESYDREIHDLLPLEADIAGNIAREVGVSIALARPNAAAARAPSPEAHEAYLLGRYYWNRRERGDWKAAEVQFRRAIELDPQYALAYAGLAECRIRKEEAHAAAMRAVELDPSSSEARIALGWVEFYRNLDVTAGGHAFHTAVELDPNYAAAHHSYSEYLAAVGRIEEAIAEKRLAVRLDPLSGRIRGALAQLLALAGEDDAALNELRMEQKLEPDFPLAHNSLAEIHLRGGRYNEAARELQLYAEHGSDSVLGMLGYTYAMSGRREEAERILGKLGKDSTNRMWAIALVEIGLGRKDEALAWLERDYQAHDDDDLLWLKVDPIYDPLRSEPRFQELLKRMNFPP